MDIPLAWKLLAQPICDKQMVMPLFTSVSDWPPDFQNPIPLLVSSVGYFFASPLQRPCLARRQDSCKNLPHRPNAIAASSYESASTQVSGRSGTHQIASAWMMIIGAPAVQAYECRLRKEPGWGSGGFKHRSFSAEGNGAATFSGPSPATRAPWHQGHAGTDKPGATTPGPSSPIPCSQNTGTLSAADAGRRQTCPPLL